jgi:hypothetical protein
MGITEYVVQAHLMRTIFISSQTANIEIIGIHHSQLSIELTLQQGHKCIFIPVTNANPVPVLQAYMN